MTSDHHDPDLGRDLRQLYRDYPEPDGRRPASARLADVAERKVAWLAEGMIPLRAVTQVVGRGGQGKTTFVLHVAARLTRGEPIFPGMRAHAPADVLIVSAEDALEYVLRPRLRIAGADLTRVHAWKLTDTDLVLPDDVDLLAQEVERTRSVMVVIDPLSAFLSDRTDSHKDASLRGVLRPLHAMAESMALAVVGILHLNQGTGGDVATRTSGSGAWINAARSALVFGPPPDAEEGDPRRIVAVAKSNYAPIGVSHEVTLRVPDGEDHPAVVYVGFSQVKARDVLSGPADEGDRTGAAECADWLAGVLSTGPRKASDIQAAATRDGFTKKNLWTASQKLGVVKDKGGFTAGWVWSLPGDAATKIPAPEDSLPSTPHRESSQEPHGQAVLGGLDTPETPEDSLGQSPHAREESSGAHRRTSCTRCGAPWPGPGTVCDPCLEDHR